MSRDALRLRGRLLAQAGLAGLALCSGAGAHAQTTAAPSATAGEVVVTAEKRSERLQDVTAPVTALDRQLARIDLADPAAALRLFRSNRDAGLILAAGLAFAAALGAT